MALCWLKFLKRPKRTFFHYEKHVNINFNFETAFYQDYL
jgi:hypothetical protein